MAEWLRCLLFMVMVLRVLSFGYHGDLLHLGSRRVQVYDDIDLLGALQDEYVDRIVLMRDTKLGVEWDNQVRMRRVRAGCFCDHVARAGIVALCVGSPRMSIETAWRHIFLSLHIFRPHTFESTALFRKPGYFSAAHSEERDHQEQLGG